MTASFSKSAIESQEFRHEPFVYTTEVRYMMHGFGDCPEPLLESARIIENVVLQQTRAIINKACEVAERRGNKIVMPEDFIFLMRKDKVKVQRLLKYLELREFKSTIFKPMETEVLESEVLDNPKKRKRACHDFVKLIDNTGELQDRQSVVDHVKHNRNIRAEMMTRKMDETRYLEFCKARNASFANTHTIKFSQWIAFDGDFKVSKEGYKVLGYLAYETVAQIVDLALIIRQDQNKIHGDAIDRLRLSYFNPYTYKPYQHNKGAVSKPISPAEINEALRRFWSPQLEMTGPFHRSSMRRQHPKLLAC